MAVRPLTLEGDAGAARADPTGSATRCGSGVIGIRRNATQHEWEYQALWAGRGLGARREGNLSSSSRATLHSISASWRYGTRIGRSAARADPASPRSPARWRRLGLMPLLNLVAVDLGEHRPDQSVPDPAARWRSPFVLRHRGRTPQTVERAHAGDQLPQSGLPLCSMLTIFVTWNDIVRSWLGGIG